MNKAWGDCTLYGPNRIGEGTYIGDNVIIGHPGKKERDLLAAGKADESSGATIGAGCVLRASGILYAGATLGDRVQTGHHWLVRESTTVGDGTLVGTGVTIDDQCIIGARVSIQTGVYIPTGTVIEDDVFLGPRVCLTNDKFMGRPVKLEGVTVRRGARIGANAVILPGIEVGEEAVVGSGAVVTKDVPPFSVVQGNPARVVADVPEEQRMAES